MTKLLEWLDGKKTYAIVFAVATIAVLNWYGVEIPEYVWAVLAALGLGFLRAGVKKTA